MAKVCPNCELAYSDDDFFCAVDGSPLRSTTADADNLVGTVIADRYRVEAIVGEGGMGRVYRARHVRVPREAAIKVLRRALIGDAYAVAAFNREARNAALVGDHPNVAAVYDFGETADGLVFLAMEFVEGETLARRLEREPIMPPARVAEIVRQIAAALTTAHELPEPVVHRDLKPDNILLKATRDGSDWVKVVDFGIAKAIKRGTQLLTTPGLVVGTPRYMSPEQLTGADIDVRSDIYALGMIAFQMLTGRMPFASSTAADESTIQWALQRLSVRPLSLAQVRPDIDWPAAAQHVFDRALAPNATDRIGSANELARSLAHAFGLATPAGVMALASDDRPRAPTPVSTASIAVPGPACATAPDPAAPAPAPARAEARPGGGVEPRVPRRRGGVVAGLVVAALVVAVGGGLWWRRGETDVAAPGRTPAAVPNDSAPRPVEPVAASSAPLDSTAPLDRRAAAAAEGKETTRGSNAGSAGVASDSAKQPSRDAPGPVIVDRPRADGGADAVRARADLDGVKAKLADPDAVASAGSGDAVLRTIARILPTLTNRADSVEATYYAIETNLILDRPAVACRLLVGVRDAARGTQFEPRVETFLADRDLACASRR